MRLPRAYTLLFALAALALLVAGCGGGGEDVDPEKELQTAFSPEGAGQVKSGNLDLNFTLETAEGGDEARGVGVSVTGPFQDGQADLTLNVSGQDPSTGQPVDFTGGLTATTDNLYVEYGDQTYELGAQRFAELKAANPQPATPADALNFTEACKQGIEQASATPGAPAIDPAVCDELDPSGWLTDIKDEGTEDIGGTESNHISAQIDFEQIITDGLAIAREALPPEQAAQIPEDLIQQASGFIEDAGIDVYVGADDDIPRRTQAELKINVLGQEVNLGLDALINDANEPQTISAPEGAQPIEALREQLPAPVRGSFDCFLNAKSATDFAACGAQQQQASGVAGATGGAL